MKTMNELRPIGSQKNKNVMTLLGMIVLSVLLLASPSVLAKDAPCQASRKSMSVYKDFRSKYPFHYQTVGLAEYPDNSCLFLISEPAPEVTEESIRQLFSQYDYSLDIRKHKLGYDGYIKDVLVVVRSVSHVQTIQLEKKLHKLLFSSCYKAERATMKLPVEKSKVFFSKDNINYKISLAELNDWFLAKNELFFNSQGEKFGIKNLLDSSRSGVYLSVNPGFVAWVINKKENLHQKKSDIRRFALDSDLLLGAFSNPNKLIIIGREREAGSLQVLQPLCTETILMLASCREPSLSQSLDMNDVMAGKVQNRNYDWCPTYLSDILENTEYGDLLTINDVLLKDWSESGNLQFYDVKYPAPKSFPFNKPLSEQLLNPQGQKYIVYNWNTTDAVYSMKTSGCSIYALANTGALPVSYYDDQYSMVSVGESYEKRACQYFAEANNTDLARAVQYSFLYSVFYDNEIFAHTTCSTKKAPSMKPYLLESKVRILLSNIKKASLPEISKIAQDLSQELLKETVEAARKKTKADFDNMIREKIEEYGVNANDPSVVAWKNENWSLTESELKDSIRQTTERYKGIIEKHAVPLIEEIQTILESMDATEYWQASRYLSYPRGEAVAQIGENPKIRRLTNALHDLKMANGIFKPFGIETGEVMDYYSNALRHEESTWIKTPTLTRTSLGENFIGGHNIAAVVRRVPQIVDLDRVIKKGASINSDAIRRRENIIPRKARSQRGL